MGEQEASPSNPLVLPRPARSRPFERPPTRAIELDDFPFEALSEVATVESWRKEIHRPIYHIHKWWAQRLGSVFRAAIIGAAAPAGTDIESLLRNPVRLDGHIIFDPFLGSGTVAGESMKLGARAVGLDINPVAIRAARAALGPLDRKRLEDAYEAVREEVERPLRAFHATTDGRGRPAEALYWFWVKQLPCPHCQGAVDLFSTRIFARHAYLKRNPLVKASCPRCGDIAELHHQAETAQCPGCKTSFDPREAPVERSSAVCPHCKSRFSLVEAARQWGHPPRHRLYAKLVLDEDGRKHYLRPSAEDHQLFQDVAASLAREAPLLPNLPIEPGYNTRQILAYNYRHWRDAFNARQLLGVSRISAAIARLPESHERAALAVLLSGVLEFNSLFASYKGEGTGAVRHMFAHHILKPERTPIEANLWGTERSSGAFSTLYRSRLLRALDYRRRPFEVLPDPDGSGRSVKVFGLSQPIDAPLLDHWPKGGLPGGTSLLEARDAARSGLPSRSVDLVVTDPPYFDNVHYSELADFFAAWTEAFFDEPARSTRQPGEVQDIDPERFSEKLRGVLRECHRVLKDEGLLVMSYHHSRSEGWLSLGRALIGAGFSVVEAHPVKAELARATPKSRTKEPIDIDMLVVARKSHTDHRHQLAAARALAVAADRAARRAARYRRRVAPLSTGDARAILASQLLVTLSPGRGEESLGTSLEWAETQSEPLVRSLLQSGAIAPDKPIVEQLPLFGGAHRSE